LEIVGLVDVQPEKQLGKGSIAPAKSLNSKRQRENGRTDEQIVLYVFFAGSSLKAPNDGIPSMALSIPSSGFFEHSDFTACRTRVSNLRYFRLDSLNWCEV
jgi:hypothetical protein